jgi:hypothetical protein
MNIKYFLPNAVQYLPRAEQAIREDLTNVELKQFEQRLVRMAQTQASIAINEDIRAGMLFGDADHRIVLKTLGGNYAELCFIGPDRWGRSFLYHLVQAVEENRAVPDEYIHDVDHQLYNQLLVNDLNWMNLIEKANALIPDWRVWMIAAAMMWTDHIIRK